MRCVEAGSRRDRGRAGCAAARDEWFGRERGHRRRPASESPVAPSYGRGARAGPSLAPAAAAAARGRSRREGGRPARAAVVGSATPPARPQPQLPRHTPPLTTVRAAARAACCCRQLPYLPPHAAPAPACPPSLRGWAARHTTAPPPPLRQSSHRSAGFAGGQSARRCTAGTVWCTRLYRLRSSHAHHVACRSHLRLAASVV